MNARAHARDATAYTIALTSCQYPGDILRRHVAYRSLATLADRSFAGPSGTQPPMVLFTAGDSIYADATAGLFDPVDPEERYDDAYRQYERALTDTRVAGAFAYRFHSIDDHELVENWEPSADPDEVPLDGTTLRQAILAFARYQQRKVDPPDGSLPLLWGAVRLPAGCSAFIMDTRTERELRSPASQGQARLFSTAQRDALFAWLTEASAADKRDPGAPVTPKVILSGSMLLPRRRIVACSQDPVVSAIRSDAWDGYPRSLHEVLAFIAAQQIEGAIFLSGDEHIACISDIDVTPIDGPPIRILSVHAAPLYAPLPFANSRPEELCGDEAFDLPERAKDTGVSVRVQSGFPLVGNGYALIDVPRDWRTERLKVRYHGDRGQSAAYRSAG